MLLRLTLLTLISGSFIQPAAAAAVRTLATATARRVVLTTPRAIAAATFTLPKPPIREIGIMARVKAFFKSKELCVADLEGNISPYDDDSAEIFMAGIKNPDLKSYVSNQWNALRPEPCLSAHRMIAPPLPTTEYEIWREELRQKAADKRAYRAAHYVLLPHLYTLPPEQRITIAHDPQLPAIFTFLACLYRNGTIGTRTNYNLKKDFPTQAEIDDEKAEEAARARRIAREEEEEEAEKAARRRDISRGEYYYPR